MSEDIVSTSCESTSSEYDTLIKTAQHRGLDKSDLDGYYEKHHIVPKSMGGDDSPDNLVLLTFPEHVDAHRLLYDIHGNREMAWALKSLCMPLKERPDIISESDKLDFLEKARKASKEYWNTEEGRSTRRAVALKQWSDPEARNRHSEILKKRYSSPEARKKKSDIAKANVKMVDNLINLNKSRVKPVTAIGSDGIEIEFQSATDAMSKGYATHAGSLSQVCNGKRGTHNGYVWKFTGDN